MVVSQKANFWGILVADRVCAPMGDAEFRVGAIYGKRRNKRGKPRTRGVYPDDRPTSRYCSHASFRDEGVQGSLLGCDDSMSGDGGDAEFLPR